MYQAESFWTEDQFVVTTSSGIRDRDTRVDEIVVRELQKVKPGKWGYVQTREIWSPKEETHEETCVLDTTGC